MIAFYNSQEWEQRTQRPLHLSVGSVSTRKHVRYQKAMSEVKQSIIKWIPQTAQVLYCASAQIRKDSVYMGNKEWATTGSIQQPPVPLPFSPKTSSLWYVWLSTTVAARKIFPRVPHRLMSVLQRSWGSSSPMSDTKGPQKPRRFLGQLPAWSGCVPSRLLSEFFSPEFSTNEVIAMSPPIQGQHRRWLLGTSQVLQRID